MKETHWIAVDWSSRGKDIPDGEPVDLQCECGMSCECPTAGNPGSLVIATFGLRVVFDNPSNVPPDHWMPDIIECPACQRRYESRTRGVK